MVEQILQVLENGEYVVPAAPSTPVHVRELSLNFSTDSMSLLERGTPSK